MKTLSAILNVRAAGITFVVLAAVASSPARAEAACGDYVHILKADAGDAAPVPMPKPPCDGPNCSNRQVPPAVPLSVPTAEREVPKPLAKLVEAFDPSFKIHVLFKTCSSLTLPDPGSSSIFHPPRSV